MPNLRLVLFAAIAVSQSAAAQSDPRPLSLGDEYTVHSAIMAEDRRIQVSLPASYGRTRISYPVLFVVDGSSHILHATATTRFLAAARERIPEMIVVAVPNTNRNRDLTPGAGAARFERYLVEELIPWVEHTFRAAPERVLMGHSLGGSFTVHVLLNRPELFTSYIAVSAPLWRYDSLSQQAIPGLARAAARGVSLHLLVGELEKENRQLFAGVAAFSSLIDSLGKAAPPKRYTVLPGEDHSSVSQRALYAALEARYAGWSFPWYEDKAGLDAVGGIKAVENHYALLSTQFRFAAPPPDSRLASAARLYMESGDCTNARAIADRHETEYPALAKEIREVVTKAKSCR